MKKNKMSSLATLDLPAGKIGFAGFPRGYDDEPRDAFRVELPGRPMMFGEWRPKFAPNGNEFDVEIVSFGYLDKGHLGSANPAHRGALSISDGEILRGLIRALFAGQTANPSVVPFTSTKGQFLGEVHLVPGWLLNTP